MLVRPRITTARAARVGAGAVLALVVGVAPALLVANPAAAVLTDPELVARVRLNPGSAGCTLTGTATANETKSFADDGRTVSSTATTTATSVNAADAADRTTLTGTATTSVRATTSDGSLGVLDLRATARTTVTPALATPGCLPGADSTTELMAAFDLRRPGWVTTQLSVSSAKQGTRYASVEFSDDTGGQQFAEVRATDLPATMTIFLGAGRHYVYSRTTSYGSTYSRATSTTSRAIVTFTPAAVATGAAAGTGRRFASLPASRDCAGDRVVVRLTGSAAKVRKLRTATFTATGARKQVVRKPRRGRAVVLRGLADTRAVTVTGTFRLKTGKKLTVRRSYRACS